MITNKIKEMVIKARDNAMAKGINAVIAVHYEKSHLMRIGNNSVSLNTSEELTRLDIVVFDGNKEAVHTQMGDLVSLEQIEEALNLTVEKVKYSIPKNYTPIKAKIEESIVEESQYDPKMEELPLSKAQLYKDIFEAVGNDYNYSGSWSSGASENFMVSTENKNTTYQRTTDQLFNLVLKHPKKQWELSLSETGWRKEDFDPAKVIKEFKDLLEVYENNDGVKIENGDYTVILGDLALAEIVQMATYGFSGYSYEQKQGWVSQNKIGDQILGENISISDIPDNELTFKNPIDGSGIIRKPFKFVENGKFMNLMYSSTAAAKYNKKQTGHDSSLNIVFATGTGEENPFEAVKDLEKVLYIPALHYMGMPNSNKGIFTGSSRFNAMLIEYGKPKCPIFSSRITDSFQNVFKNVSIIAQKAVSANLSSTYGRRSPVALSVPKYIVANNVKITDSADSF